MIGKKFGKWVVVEECPPEKSRRGKKWLCKCLCGFETTFTTSYLNTGQVTCCKGCRKRQKEANETFLIQKYLNKKIGDYTVKKYVGKNKYGSRLWLCECKCGFQREFNTSYLTGGSLRTATQCKKCYKKEMELSNRITNDIPNRFWYKFLNVANRRNIEVGISKKCLFELYLKQNKKCSLTGQDLYFTKLRSNFNRYTNASIDRIDSSKGYVKDNIQWVHKKVNMMKQRYSQEEFIEICKMVANNF